jgi:hypothetical protein
MTFDSNLVKQACASLSNLSFIITRYGDRVELGILMEELQSDAGGIVAPHSTLDIDDNIYKMLKSLGDKYPKIYGK